MTTATVIKGATTAVTALAAVAFVARPHDAATDLPNRIPEAAPYLTSEAQVFPPPYEEYWATQNHPGQCANCHRKIFDEWNGSMMSNSWRDPVWRAAFLLLARAVSTNGECDTTDAARRHAQGDPQPVRARRAVRVSRSTSAPARSRSRARAPCWTRSARAVTCRPTTSTTFRCAT